MNYTETNKLIAEFDGMTNHHNDKSMMVRKTPLGNEVVSIQELDYYNSWQLLMPVVEKIKDMGYDQELDNIDNVLTCDLSRENLYNVVVEFINFYNNQNT